MIPFRCPPPITQPAPRVIPLNEALEQVMQDFDAEDPALPLRNPAVPRVDQPSLRWFRSAALSEIPENPFRKGTPSFLEAKALLAVMKVDGPQAENLISEIKVQEPGTALALWRWAKRRERAKPWSPAARAAWEDKLMSKSLPSVLNDYALRHALCWALAEKDEQRFATLKAAWGEDAPSLFASFQGLFGWFKEMSPVVRLWSLPGLEYQDQRLDTLKAFEGGKPRHIWISPDTSPMPKLPAGTAWIIPSATGSQNSNEPSLNQTEQAAGASISTSLSTAKGQAYFAACRAEFETLGLVFFPALIELDSKGAIQEIHMGDACPNSYLFRP